MKRVLENIFSNWANLVVTVLISFLVSPVIVKGIGAEMYGVLVLILSVTGYFTVLDLGINTAIVRYVSRSVARNDYGMANAVYSTSSAVFALMAGGIVAFSLIFGFFIGDIFHLGGLSRGYLYLVFLLSGFDMACGLFFSVSLGCLCGLQEFRFVNSTSICVNLVKSAIVVYLVHHGFGLMTVVAGQLLSTLARSVFQLLRVKTRYPFLSFSRAAVNRESVRLIYDYSVYSFIIAIALKVLFYTDSLVIGSLIGLTAVTYFAIPSTLMDYLEKFIWSMIAVLVPVISSNEAMGVNRGNEKLYVMGTRYSLLVSLPVVISLYFFGEDFIRLWMGPDLSQHSRSVLRLLLIGYGFSFSQLIAHGILKGMSRHKTLSYILIIEAVANLLISLLLARPFGIEGVAAGTMVPLLIFNVVIMLYCCRVLCIKVLSYLYASYLAPVLCGVAIVPLRFLMPGEISTYSQLILCSTILVAAYAALSIFFVLDSSHRELLAANAAMYRYQWRRKC